MTGKKKKKTNKTGEELRQLIDGDASEETVHQFFKERVFRIGHGNPRFSERFIVGVASKFPITPDRIPDFTAAFLNVRESQRPSRVSFIELKKPNTPLYTSHARMSKDLNDAWMECVETSRLIADNFRDCLRRLVKALDQKRLEMFDAAYRILSDESYGDDERYRNYLYYSLMPSCNSTIVIGRRSMLDSEGLLRTRELSASTDRSIQVITYDTVVDWVAEADENDHEEPWSMFLRGWYW